MATAGRLLWLLLAEAVVCFSFINYFCRAFGISRWLIPLHLSVVFPLLIAGLLVPGLSLFSRQRRGATARLLAIVPGLLAAALALLYAVSFSTNVWLGHNLTHMLAGFWLSDWWAGGELLALSPWVVTLLVAVAAGIVVVHVAFAPAMVSAAEAIVARLGRRGAFAAAVLAMGAAAFGVRELQQRTPRSELLSSDPVLAFFRSTVSVMDDERQAQLAGWTERERECRAQAARAPGTPRKNVVLVIVDSLRADHLPLYGYGRQHTPFLASLAASGRLRKAEFATSTCAESNCGIISTLASKTLRNQFPASFKLHELLRDRGYQSYFILSGNHDWQGLREMYGNEHSLYFDGRDSKAYARSDDRVLFEGLDRVPDGAGPAFFYFHLMSVHLVGTKLDAFKRFHPSSVESDWDALFAGRYDRASVVNNYDNGVHQADATIRQLFDRLRAKGYLQDSVVVILADHGEGLGDRGERHFGHVASLYQEFIRIPLLIYEEEPAAYANLEFATQIDVAPTIVSRLGLPVPSCWQGSSMLTGPAPPLTVHQTSVNTPCYALLSRRDGTIMKFMRCFLGRREEVYDLGADPGETVNLRDTLPPARLAELRDALEQMRLRTGR